ncbi:MAG: lysylphosphatidylglycerol synthase domain-containing protein [Ilumatobacteraceae bacterium]
MLNPDRAPRLFVHSRTEPRARRATDAILLVACIIGLWVMTEAALPDPGVLTAFVVLLRSAPAFLETAWQISIDLLALYAIVLLVAAVVRHRFDVARDLVLGLIVAIAVWLLVARFAEGEWPALWASLRSAGAPTWYPSPRIALPAAVLVTISPHLSRPARRVGRWLLALGVLGVMALGAASTLGALAGVLVGGAAGAVVHLALGSSAGRPSVDDVRRALAQVGVATTALSPADRQPAGHFEVIATDADGHPLVVKVYGRDAHDSALVNTIWRAIWYREPGAPLRLGRLQQVEHEAFVTLLAAQAGVITESVVTAAATADDDALLVLRGCGAPLDVDAPPADTPAQLWDMVAQLHAQGISHGAIDPTTLIVDDGRVGLVDFGGAGVTATAGQLQTDRVQVLATVAMLTDESTALQSAVDALGLEGVAALLPYLQRAVLTPRQRAADIDLDALRSGAAETAGVEEPSLQRLRRITIGAILRVVLPGLAIVALTSAMAGLELDGVWDELLGATWWLLLLGFIAANLTRVTQALSTVGASPKPLPLGPVYALQLSSSYIQIAIPSYAARVAVVVRFFQRQAVPAGAALAAGFLDVMTTFFIEVIGITCLILFTPASLDLDFTGVGDTARRLLWIVGVLIVLAVLTVIVVRKLRTAVVEWAKRLGTEALTVIKGLHSPRRLALLLGGNLATEVLFTSALGLFALSMGHTASFADLLLIHLSVSLLAGLMPVPGGMGVAEAMLTYGLIRTGMPDGAAFAAVIAYRSSTFYLPPIWGFFALKWLERNKHL